LPNEGSSRWGGGVTAEDMEEMVWTKPKLVAQIQFVDCTAENRLRHSKFLGLRTVKEAVEFTVSASYGAGQPLDRCGTLYARF
jgi:ATP-dependent DNA ligase